MSGICCKPSKFCKRQKIIEHNSKWLKLKASKLKELYSKTILSFQEKVYALVHPVVNEASKVLTFQHEDEFLKDLYDVGLSIEKCCHKLYELNLLHCDEFNSASDDENDCDSSDDLASQIDLLHDSSSMSVFDVTPSAIKNLSPSELFPANMHLPQIGSEGNPIQGDLLRSQHHPVLESYVSLENLPIETFSIACQFDTVQETATKTTQTDIECHKNTMACQTENAVYETDSKAIQTDAERHKSAMACQTDDLRPTMESTAVQTNDLQNYQDLRPTTASTAVQTNNLDNYQKLLVEDESKRSSGEVLPKVCLSQSSLMKLDSQINGTCDRSRFAQAESTPQAEIEKSSLNPVSMESVIHENEIDLLLLHNIEIGQRTSVMVSVVVSPSQFSIQPRACKDQLVELQDYIRNLYSSKKGSQLTFKTMPEVNSVCVAFLKSDQTWYRAKISKRISPFKVEVMFIDFGDYSEVEIKNLRRIDDPYLANIPQFSIPCSLCGVEPACSNGLAKWSEVALNWFRRQILNKLFDVLFVRDYSDQKNSNYTVHLLNTDDNKGGNAHSGDSISIANALVNHGYATFSLNMPNHSSADEAEQDAKEEVKTLSTNPAPKPKNPGPWRSRPSSSASCGDVGPVQSNLDEDAYSWRPSSLPDAPPVQAPNENCAADIASFLMDDVSSYGNDLDDVESQCLDFEQASSCDMAWDPMKEDFTSDRNRYDVNIDDPCVAVENVDPRKTEICKYFAKGDCWRGKHCNNRHATNPDVLYEVEVLSGHMLNDIKLTPEELIIIKITTVLRNDDFYVHIIRRDQDVTGPESQSSIMNLEQLSRDLKAYYLKYGTRQSIEKQVCIGEVYALLHEQKYHRVTVIDIPRATRVKVHLVDYGFNVTVSPSRLLPTIQAFMHMPKQAVLCTYDKSNSAVLAEKDHSYFATVGETMESVDSPTPLTLLSKF